MGPVNDGYFAAFLCAASSFYKTSFYKNGGAVFISAGSGPGGRACITGRINRARAPPHSS